MVVARQSRPRMQLNAGSMQETGCQGHSSPGCRKFGVFWVYALVLRARIGANVSISEDTREEGLHFGCGFSTAGMLAVWEDALSN